MAKGEWQYLGPVDLVEGGQKIIQTTKGTILRRVWQDPNTKEYSIQLNNQMPKVIREVVNNTEIFTLVE